MNSSENRSDRPDLDVSDRDQDRLRASRRRAILSGLGKGSAALAALSPLASQASRSHVLFNPAENRNCYCTVSGFQSAALSPSTGANPPTCAAYLPRTFLVMPVVSITYSDFLVPPTPGNSRPKQIADHLNGLLGITSITGPDVSDTLRANTPVPLVVAGSNAVFLPRGTNPGQSCYFLRARNFPTGISSTGKFNTIFTNSADARTLLQVLFEGVTTADGGVSNTPPTAKCYFLSSYLSISNSNVSPVLPVDLTRTYIVGQYGGDSDAALTADAGLFFNKLCTKSA